MVEEVTYLAPLFFRKWNLIQSFRTRSAEHDLFLKYIIDVSTIFRCLSLIYLNIGSSNDRLTVSVIADFFIVGTITNFRSVVVKPTSAKKFSISSHVTKYTILQRRDLAKVQQFRLKDVPFVTSLEPLTVNRNPDLNKFRRLIEPHI